MQYPSMGKNRQYRVTIPQLNGGVNYAVPPHLIEDNQLSDVKNMWYKDGRLQTRPAFSSVESVAVDTVAKTESAILGGIQKIEHISTIKAKNKICVTSIADEKVLIFSFFNTDGTHKKSFFRDFEDSDMLKHVFVIENATQSELGAEAIAFIYDRDNNMRVWSINSENDAIGETVELYVPTLLTQGEPSETNTETYSFNEAALLEPMNLLTDSFKCNYLTDGKGIYYYLPKQDMPALKSGEIITVTHITAKGTYTRELTSANASGRVYTESSEQPDGKLVIDLQTGIFHFTKDGKAIAQPLAQVEGNMQIEIKRTTASKANTICNMNFSTWFGGGSAGLTGGTRLFVSGDPEHPSLMHWSALNDPLYFPENNSAEVGDNTQAITAFGKQSELLVIFKERELFCSYYVQGSSPTAEQLQNQQVIDIEAARALFPIYQLHPAVGCDCPDTIRLCNNRLVWFNSDLKVYGLFTTGQYSERNVRELSRPIEKPLQKLRDEIDPADGTVREYLINAVATEYKNNYLLHIGNRVFVMDYSSYGFTYFSSYSSDDKMAKAVTWYAWEIGDEKLPAICSACERYGKPIYIAQSGTTYHSLMLVDDAAVDTLGEVEIPITSVLCTKLFDFGYPERLKRINPFYLQVSGAKGATVKLTYFRGDGKALDDYAPVLTANGLEEANPIRVTPNASRVREFGIGLESKGRMEIGSLTLNYSMMGTVR